jgi:DNA polymerase-3 subunit delta
MPLNAADALIEIVGTDAGRLANEIEKLALYCGSRKTIAVEDIEQLCGPTAERSVFLMNDLIAEGKTDQALQTLETLLRTDRSAEYTMVGVLAFSLRRLLKARSLADAGYNESQILQACGIYPGLAERFLGQFRRFTVAKLRKLLNELTETDLASKTGLGDVKLNLEKFIVCACTG